MHQSRSTYFRKPSELIIDCPNCLLHYYFLEHSSNAHNLSHTLHAAAEQPTDRVKLFEIPMRDRGGGACCWIVKWWVAPALVKGMMCEGNSGCLRGGMMTTVAAAEGWLMLAPDISRPLWVENREPSKKSICPWMTTRWISPDVCCTGDQQLECDEKGALRPITTSTLVWVGSRMEKIWTGLSCKRSRMSSRVNRPSKTAVSKRGSASPTPDQGEPALMLTPNSMR